jgi:metalloprotein, YbeY family
VHKKEMIKMCEIIYEDVEPNEEYEKTIKKVLEECYKTENLTNSKLIITITLTTPEKIRQINNEYRQIDKATDVLSFPMFEKTELDEKIKKQEFLHEDVLGDIIISVQKVEEQAKEYGHSFERELSYMVVHGFYHLMGYDHIEEKDKIIMRPKEENVLSKLGITREKE